MSNAIHRHTVSVYVRNREQVDRVLQVLQEAEEQGDLDFPFDVRTEAGGVGGWVAIKDAGIDVTLFASAETLHRVGRELMEAATHIQKWRDAEQLVEDIEEASSASDVVTKLNEFTDKWRQDNATKGGSDE